MKFFINLDDKYLRRWFVYKYEKRKKNMYNVEVGDVLREYKMIEDELDMLDSDSEEDNLERNMTIKINNKIKKISMY